VLFPLYKTPVTRIWQQQLLVGILLLGLFILILLLAIMWQGEYNLASYGVNFID